MHPHINQAATAVKRQQILSITFRVYIYEKKNILYAAVLIVHAQVTGWSQFLYVQRLQ